MSSMKALNQIDGSELRKKVGFKHSEKVLVALRGVYNLPFNLDDPVCHVINKSLTSSRFLLQDFTHYILLWSLTLNSNGVPAFVLSPQRQFELR